MSSLSSQGRIWNPVSTLSPRSLNRALSGFALVLTLESLAASRANLPKPEGGFVVISSWGQSPVNRSDFQELAELHLRHAKALSDAQLYSGAYYMSGYTIECALKACIARRTNQFDFPDKRFASSAWTHDLAELAKVSGMKSDFDAAKQADDVLRANWQAVDGWSETSRYETHLQHEAESLLTAVSDPDHGVLACIKRYW